MSTSHSDSLFRTWITACAVVDHIENDEKEAITEKMGDREHPQNKHGISQPRGAVGSGIGRALRLCDMSDLEKIETNIIPNLRLAPYERRVIELLRNSKDKRARKLAKNRVCTLGPTRTSLGCSSDIPTHSSAPLAAPRERWTR